MEETKRKEEPMHRKAYLGAGIILFSFIFSALSDESEEKPPAPSEITVDAVDVASRRAELAGQVVQIKFNRIYYVSRLIKSRLFSGDLRSQADSIGNTYYNREGIDVRFMDEGYGYLSQFIPPEGIDENDVSNLIKSNEGEVYVWINVKPKEDSLVLGDIYETNDDGGTYSWSKKTDVPDLMKKRYVTTSEMVFFDTQLKDKIVKLEFHEVTDIEQKSPERYKARIRDGYGHTSVSIYFPKEAEEFFQKIATQTKDPSPQYVYAEVKISEQGYVAVFAKGRRLRGSTYRW
jgi:hypothetical protein